MVKKVLLPGFLIVLISVFTYSLTLEIISVERMAKESHAIIKGKISSSYSVWEGKNIYTYTTVKIEKKYKRDDLGNYLTVKQLGGQVGDIIQDIAGTPRLTKDEEVILFLTFWKGNYWIHSIVLGKFSVMEENGQRFAENNLNNINLVDPVTKKEITEPDAKHNKFLLSAFEEQINSYVRGK
jgi:hypothetical protein